MKFLKFEQSVSSPRTRIYAQLPDDGGVFGVIEKRHRDYEVTLVGGNDAQRFRNLHEAKMYLGAEFAVLNAPRQE